MTKQRCIICRKPLGDGIIVNGRGICRCCEEKMIKTAMDTDFYVFYKNCIRKTIVDTVLRGEECNCQNYHL